MRDARMSGLGAVAKPRASVNSPGNMKRIQFLRGFSGFEAIGVLRSVIEAMSPKDSVLRRGPVCERGRRHVSGRRLGRWTQHPQTGEGLDPPGESLRLVLCLQRGLRASAECAARTSGEADDVGGRACRLPTVAAQDCDNESLLT